MTPMVGRIKGYYEKDGKRNYVPSKWSDKYNDKWDYSPYNDWYTDNQTAATTYMIPMVDNATVITATSQMTTMNPITVTFTGNLDQAAVDQISKQLTHSLQQQRVYDPPPPKRRSAPREFNKYINGSDLVEEFIRYCGTLGIRQGEVMNIPIDSFIKWLIIEACVIDEEEPEVTLELGPSAQPRCLGCGRYVPRATKVLLHDERCAGFHFARQRKQMTVLHEPLSGGVSQKRRTDGRGLGLASSLP